MQTDVIINGDCLAAMRGMPSKSINCCVTSPPYYALRDYGIDGQIGREATPQDYVRRLVDVFHELYRILRTDGTFWLNISDTYCGTGSKGGHTDPKNPVGRNGQRTAINQRVPFCKPKDLIGIPWMLALALRADGWHLRSDIIWMKSNPMPESVKDRPTRSYEHIFLLSKSPRYYYDAEAIKEPCSESNAQDLKRNKRDVWQINTVPYRGAHFAAFPPKLAETCILAGCPKDGLIIDPFFGSGTTGAEAKRLARHYIGIEINPEYCSLAEKRIGGVQK